MNMLSFKNVKFRAMDSDYRPAIVADKISNSSFQNVTVDEPQSVNKQQIYKYKSPNTDVK